MCRNIKVLFNFDPPANKKEIEDASLQFIRKISGYHNPSRVNNQAFHKAVSEVAKASKHLLFNLKSDALKKDRVEELKKAQKRAVARIGRYKKITRKYDKKI